jgi:hypothetical protein
MGLMTLLLGNICLAASGRTTASAKVEMRVRELQVHSPSKGGPFAISKKFLKHRSFIIHENSEQITELLLF